MVLEYQDTRGPFVIDRKIGKIQKKEGEHAQMAVASLREPSSAISVITAVPPRSCNSHHTLQNDLDYHRMSYPPATKRGAEVHAEVEAACAKKHKPPSTQTDEEKLRAEVACWKEQAESWKTKFEWADIKQRMAMYREGVSAEGMTTMKLDEHKFGVIGAQVTDLDSATYFNYGLFATNAHSRPEVAATLVSLLQHEACRLTTIVIEGLLAEDMLPLASALQHEACKLTELWLRRGDLQNDEYYEGDGCDALPGLNLAALGPALQHEACRLTKLNLSKNKLQTEGIAMLTSALQHGACRLTDLDLSHNRLGIRGLMALGPALQNEACRLTTLDLSNNELEDWSADVDFAYDDEGHLVIPSKGALGDERSVRFINTLGETVNLNLVTPSGRHRKMATLPQRNSVKIPSKTGAAPRARNLPPAPRSARPFDPTTRGVAQAIRSRSCRRTRTAATLPASLTIR